MGFLSNLFSGVGNAFGGLAGGLTNAASNIGANVGKVFSQPMMNQGASFLGNMFGGGNKSGGSTSTPQTFYGGQGPMAFGKSAQNWSGGGNNFSVEETPTGTIDGANVTFTVANTPIAGTFALYLNGQRLTAGVEYTRSGTTVTFVTAPTNEFSSAIMRVD